MSTNPETLQKVLQSSKLSHLMIRTKTTNSAWFCPCSTAKRAQFGFTLVELLVVIAIIALLLSILMPSLRKAKSMAMRLACAHNLKQIDLAVSFYLNENDNTYPCAQDPVSTEPPYWLWMGRGWRFLVEPYLGGNIDELLQLSVKRSRSLVVC